MIDTREYRNYNNFGYQLLYILRHPIEFIRTFKDNMYNWPDPANTIRKHWMKLYIRLPFQKPCRWLGSMLIDRIYDSKLLDTFYCRTRGENIKYYTASCAFGRIKFYEITHKRNGKNVNTFMDVFVTTLVDQEQGKKNAEAIKTTKKLIYSGWVFTRKKAIKVFKEVIKKNSKLFKGEWKDSPEANNPYYIENVNNMLVLLGIGKFDHKDEHFDGNVILEKTFNETKDNIVKLWCYVTYLLCCRNDFNAHNELVDIENTCSWYMFVKARQKDPMIDGWYKQQMKKGKVKEAKKYISLIRKEDKNIKEDTIIRLREKLFALKEKYINEELEYYRI